jgi:hypothetical protein
LPGSLVTVLDGAHPDIGWRQPDEDWIAKHRDALQEALATLKRALAPAPEDFIRERLAVLATYKGSRAGHPAEWKLRAAEYLRLLAHYPADIWQVACDEWALGNRYFPDLSELNELMLPRLQERRRHVERLEAMLIVKVEHKQLVCEVWRAHEAELKAEIGERMYQAWLSQATPHGDDGATLVLVVPTQWIATYIRDKFGPILERHLAREVRFIVRPWAGPAARDRRAREEGSEAAA